MQNLTFKKILKLFESQGCNRLIVKKLSQNDNSKQQIYLGGHDAIQLLPSIETTLSKQSSRKKKAEKYIFRSRLDFYWLNEGTPESAPNAKLIYYPQYPETRFSGFLQGSKVDLSYWFKIENKDEWPDRVLFLGSNKKNQTFGYIQELTNSVNLSLSKNAVSLRGDDVFLECFLNVQQNYVTEIISAMREINGDGMDSVM